MPLLNATQLQALRATLPQGRNRVRAALVIAGVSQAELGRRIGKSPSYVADIISGRYETTQLDTAQLLATVIGCSVDDLFIRPKRMARLAS